MTIDLASYTITRREIIPCVTTQGNSPHRPHPWAQDGICSICEQPVDMIRIGPDNPYVYSHIAVAHTREMTWHEIDADELRSLIQYTKDW
jgi:hypothetical protein